MIGTFFVAYKKFDQMAYLNFFLGQNFFRIEFAENGHYFQLRTPVALSVLKLGYLFVRTFFLSGARLYPNPEDFRLFTQ